MVDQGQIALRAAIANFTAAVEDFNVRPLSLGDPHYHCHAHRIEIISLPLRLAGGCAFYEQEFPFIALNSKLGDPWRTIAGWHEFAHHVLGHLSHGAQFSSPDSKERQPLDLQAQASRLAGSGCEPDPAVFRPAKVLSIRSQFKDKGADHEASPNCAFEYLRSCSFDDPRNPGNRAGQNSLRPRRQGKSSRRSTDRRLCLPR